MKLANLIAIAISVSTVSAQSPAFEVATIKPNHSARNAISGRGVCTSRGAVSVQNIPLDLVIGEAYGVKPFQLKGRPDWLSSDRFDIEARPATPVNYDECIPMVQSLLSERFKLVLHRETRQLPIYKLLLAKSGPKLPKKVPADGPRGIKTFSTTTGKLNTWGISMPQLAGMLAMTGQLDNLVVDGTGLDGYYEFTLDWTPDILAADGATGPSLFTALQEQLGLRLQAGKGPVEVLVIDQIQRVPTEN